MMPMALSNGSQCKQVPSVAVRNLSKRFPGVLANDRVALEFFPGEIHVLLGENGAGKSTLIGILAGMQQPDEGEILIGGLPVTISSPRRSIELGIGIVYQQVLLAPSLTVIENLMLGGAWWRRLARTNATRRFEALSAMLGAKIDRDARVARLSLGEQQQVEIMRALWRGQKVLILDEPTSMLTAEGARDLGEMLRRLKAQGVAVVLVTHKLKEAWEFGDCISVLRLGRLAGEIARDRLRSLSEAETAKAAVRMMFGTGEYEHDAACGELQRDRTARINRNGSQRVSVRALATAGSVGEMPLRDVNFDLWPAEVLGIAGVDGNGQKHLAEVLAGQRPLQQGHVTLAGADITRENVPARRRRGMRYVTDERLGEGAVGAFSVATNLLLKRIGAPPYWRAGISDWNLIHHDARQQIQRHDIRTASERTPLAKLSGGNVQKVLLARELDAGAQVVVFNKPTYGLDVQSRRRIHERMAAAVARGISLVVISTDLDELLEISDRIGVMYQGRLTGIVENGGRADQAVALLMTGAAAP
jgi:general nucleoside transport system ATP-binding protein